MYSVNQTKTNRYCGILGNNICRKSANSDVCLKSAGGVGLLQKKKIIIHIFLSVLKSDVCSVFCLTQHHSEGVEGSASFAQL